MAVGNTLRLVVSALSVLVVLVLAMLVASSGNPTAHDWYTVLAIGAAASVGLLWGAWRKNSRT